MKIQNRWVYVAAGTIAMIFAGLVYAWTTMAAPICACYPDWNEAQISLTFTIVMLGFCLGNIIGGILIKKIRPVFLVWASAVLFIAGFLITSISQSLAVLYIGFGVMGGIGSGISYNVVMSSVLKWFPDRQGLVSGILLMGFGIGSFFIGKAYTALTPADGSDVWRTSFRILGIILFVIMILAGFFMTMPSEDWQPPAGKKRKSIVYYSDVRSSVMLRNPSFWFFFIWAVCMAAAGLMIISQGRPIAMEVMGIKGVADASAAQLGSIATLVGLISVFNAVGRVFFGFLFDKIGRFTEMLMGCIVFIVGLVLIIVSMKSHSEAVLVIAYIITGVAYGCLNPTNSSFIRQYFGPTHFPMNFSFINMILLIASFSSTLAGAVFDATGSYLIVILITIGLCILGLIMNFLIRKPSDSRQ